MLCLGGRIMQKNLFVIGIIFLFVFSAVSPIVFGYNIITSNKETKTKDDNFDRYLYPEYYDCYNVDEIPSSVDLPNQEFSENENIKSVVVTNPDSSSLSLDGLMDSDWPMCCHDTRHTGLSPYSTENNPFEEKWWYKTDGYVEGSPVIDNDGVIYFGSWNNYLYAVYPDGTMKWKFYIDGTVETSPAIADDGTIYVGTYWGFEGNHFFAINPDGTEKWRYDTSDMYTSPAIAKDGTIYVNDVNFLLAFNPDGTIKWTYPTEHVALSSPAVDKNGIIYFGSNDNNVYALYPNGTLKWKFDTGSWVHGCPTIADDGTIYIDSDDFYLYALDPDDGSMIWKCYVGSVWGCPALDKDGNIYLGTWEKKFYSIYPNGDIRWSIDLDYQVWGMSAAVSEDGTIYFGTCDFGPRHSGPLHILNNDGTVKKILSYVTMFWSSPAIGSDGTIYICSQKRETKYGENGEYLIGYLFALNELDPDAPTSPVISGRTSGTYDRVYDYTLKSTSPLGNDIYYWVEWGDKNLTSWIGPYHSGEEVKVSHKWIDPGTYHIIAKAKDIDNLWGPWGELTVTMPKNKAVDFNSLFLNLLEKFPILQKILLSLIN